MRIYILIGMIVCAMAAFVGYYWYRQQVMVKIEPIVAQMDWQIVPNDQADTSLVAQSKSGAVLGERLQSGVIQFLSIPFAKPPLGKLRYTASEPAVPWQGILDARTQAPRCLQVDSMGLGVWAGGQSEDCLWLSIRTPALDGEKRPVLVWIHGGGLHSGGAAEPVYNGENLAARGDVVVVNLQYRLGTLGYLDVSHLGDEMIENAKENGLMDQLLGLRWVHDNIAAFGGDPENITLFGESAGSYSVTALTHLPEAQDLYAKRILMSGVYTPVAQEIDSKQTTKRYMDALGAQSLEDLRSASSEDLLKAQVKLEQYARSQGLPDIQALIDLRPPSQAEFTKAAQSGKPLMHGTTAQEYHLFTLFSQEKPKNMAYTYLANTGATKKQVDTLVNTIRPHLPNRDEDDLYLDAISTAFMHYPHKVVTDIYREQGTPVYQYIFDWTSPLTPDLEAYHALDLNFTFGTLEAGKKIVGDQPPKQLSEQMQDAIISFARTGVPEVPDKTTWTPMDREHNAMMVFSEDSQMVNNPMPWLENYAQAFETILDSKENAK